MEGLGRYDGLRTKKFLRPDGREVTYLGRRFLPSGDELSLLAEVRTEQGDRIDRIAATHLGDPLQFYRICDANNAMTPGDLVAETGRTLRIPLPWDGMGN